MSSEKIPIEKVLDAVRDLEFGHDTVESLEISCPRCNYTTKRPIKDEIWDEIYCDRCRFDPDLGHQEHSIDVLDNIEAIILKSEVIG